MKAPTPPKGLQEEGLLEEVAEDIIEVERSETVEIVLFEYEDDDVSFSISFEFVYSFTQQYDSEEVLA